MLKQFYFSIFSSLMLGKAYILRLVVQRGNQNTLLDHYFEYGLLQRDSLTLENSIWSSDADALVDNMPQGERFHASMDIRLFLRNDLEDALNGSLMTDEFEVVLNGHAPLQPAPAAICRT